MNFEIVVQTVSLNGVDVVLIPVEISKRLPSRGMVMVCCQIDGEQVDVPLEPDGKGGHWFELKGKLIDRTHQTVAFETLNVWPEPDIPEDIMDALAGNGLLNEWSLVTTKAKWEWLRWIRATQNPSTRKSRIVVACSKLSKGDKRPCCFDSTRCTVTEVSKSGVLLD